MDFRYDEDERDVIEQARQTFSRYLPPGELIEGSRTVGWQRIGADGWLHAGLSSQAGGMELPLAVVSGIGREAGRVAAADAFVDNGVIIPALLATIGRENALAEALSHPGFLVADGRQLTLSEPADAASATPWCFGTESGFWAYWLSAKGDMQVYSPESWTLEPLGGLGPAVGTVTLRDDATPHVLGMVDISSCDELIAQASVVHAAGLVGLGEKALGDTLAYVTQREQFGTVIGRFQAVKHALADTAVSLEVAWDGVLYASLALDSTSVSTARVLAATAAKEAVRNMVQFIGGIAMTWEHHAHVYVKAALAGAQRFGDADEHARRLGRQLAGVQFDD